jgi:hypothetical protein
VSLEKRQRLVDAVLFVTLGFLNVAALNELDDPARVEIDTEGDAAAMLREMLDSEAEAAGAAGAEVQPVSAAREKLVRQGAGECFVIDAEILMGNAGFRHASGASGFERKDRFVRVRLRHPAPHGSTAQPFIFEESKTIEILIRLNVAEGIEVERLGAVDPERSPGCGIEVPLDDFAGPCV